MWIKFRDKTFTAEYQPSNAKIYASQQQQHRRRTLPYIYTESKQNQENLSRDDGGAHSFT